MPGGAAGAAPLNAVPSRSRTGDFPGHSRAAAPPPGPFPYFPGPRPRPRRRPQHVPRPAPRVTPRPGFDHAAPRRTHWPAEHGPAPIGWRSARPRPAPARRILVRLPPRPAAAPSAGSPPLPHHRGSAGQSGAGGRRRVPAPGARVAEVPLPRTCRRRRRRALSLRPAVALWPRGCGHHAHADLRGSRRGARGEWPWVAGPGREGERAGARASLWPHPEEPGRAAAPGGACAPRHPRSFVSRARSGAAQAAGAELLQPRRHQAESGTIGRERLAGTRAAGGGAGRGWRAAFRSSLGSCRRAPRAAGSCWLVLAPGRRDAWTVRVRETVWERLLLPPRAEL